MPVGYLTCSAKQMLFQLPIYHQNKGEEVAFYSTSSLYIYLCYLYLHGVIILNYYYNTKFSIITPWHLLCVFYLCLVRFQLVSQERITKSGVSYKLHAKSINHGCKYYARCVTRGGRGGRTPLPLFENQKKVPWF